MFRAIEGVFKKIHNFIVLPGCLPLTVQLPAFARLRPDAEFVPAFWPLVPAFSPGPAGTPSRVSAHLRNFMFCFFEKFTINGLHLSNPRCLLGSGPLLTRSCITSTAGRIYGSYTLGLPHAAIRLALLLCVSYRGHRVRLQQRV